MHMEETQAELATSGSGGMGADVTTLIEGVEPSSFAAATACMTIEIVFFSTTCPGDTQEILQSFSVSCPCFGFGGARTINERFHFEEKKSGKAGGRLLAGFQTFSHLGH